MGENNKVEERINLANTIMDQSESINIVEAFTTEMKEKWESMGKVNLVIAGKTGVGKSTLINAAFGEDLAETGVGKPVTEGIKEYKKDNFPLRIYDTMGLELSEDRQDFAIKQIKNLCKEKKLSDDTSDYLHFMWYCVHGNGARFEEYEKNFVNAIAEEMPVMIVFTQTIIKSLARELKEQIEDMGVNARYIITVRAQSYTDDEGKLLEPFGVSELIEATYRILPSAVQKAFANAQKASLKVKERQATEIIAGTVAVAFGEGFSPLPFSDAVVLVPTEIAMIAGITAVYGLDLEKSVITGLVTSVLGCSGATAIGKTVVANLLKLIPGGGTVVGGFISGGVATTLTFALGRTYIVIMNKLFDGELKQEDLEKEEMKEIIKNIFKEQVKIGKKKEDKEIE